MRRSALAVFGIILAWGVLELIVRIGVDEEDLSGFYDTSAPAMTRRWVPHPFLPYAGPAGSRIVLKDGDSPPEEIVTNSYGFRAHEFPHSKSPEAYVVLCFGGSTTYGYKAPDNASTWPERLESLLQERLPRRKVRVYNLGVDMASSAFSIVNLALVGVHLDPDLVIVYHGYNELAVLDTGGYRWDHSHHYTDLQTDRIFWIQSKVPGILRESQALMMVTGALDRAFGANDLAALATRESEPATNPRPEIDALLVNYRTLHSLAVGTGAEILFSTFQFRDGDERPNRAWNRILREEFTRNGWWFVDQDALVPDYDPTLQVDECHFTQKGRDLVARNFFDAIVGHWRDVPESAPEAVHAPLPELPNDRDKKNGAPP